jgi:predicted RNase H-like nuclease (RuvC/YqgF family)
MNQQPTTEITKDLRRQAIKDESDILALQQKVKELTREVEQLRARLEKKNRFI